MKRIEMKEINHRAIRGIGWVGKAALLCLGILAMLVAASLLMAVMLMATVLPATAKRHKRKLGDRRESRNTSELPAPRKALAS